MTKEKTMRALALAALLTSAAIMPAAAALPPQYQRQAELAAIINDPSIADVFGFDGISSIEFVRPDQYRLTGGDCTLEVIVEDLPNEHPEGWAGPRQFKIVRGEPVCP
jgi:hypothetical protein